VNDGLQLGELRMLEVASTADLPAPPGPESQFILLLQSVGTSVHRECARALIAAPVRGRLVTEIAFDYGFNSLTHFGRVFRHQFGLTPSEYRRGAR
jgi:AraC-like DNA-binding protein